MGRLRRSLRRCEERGGRLPAAGLILAAALLSTAAPASAAGTEITGKVTSAVTSAALAGVEVCEYAVEGGAGDACASTGAGGEYTLAVGRAGEFVLYFDTTAPGLVPRTFYKDTFTSRGATIVKVGEGKTISGVDEAIAEGGSIAGAVHDRTSKAALQGIEACAQLPNVNQSFVERNRECATTNAAGEYTIGSLTPGNGVPEGGYEVEFGGPLNYITQYYDGKLERWDAKLLPVALGETVPGIDAELEEGGEISGRVTSQVAGEPVAGAEACAEEYGLPEYCAKTDAAGEYTIAKLPSHSYRVHFSGPGGLQTEYIGQYYEEKEWPEIEPVPVTAPGKVTHINAALKEYGRIHGVVTDKETKQPIEGVNVCIGAGASPCDNTNAAGEYTFNKQLAGTYSLAFYAGRTNEEHATNYLSQYESYEYIVQEELKARNPEAASFHVAMGATATIDDSLEEGASITGTMLEAGTKKPASLWPCAEDLSTGHPEHAIVCPYSIGGDTYTIKGLPPGRYRVHFGGGIPAYYFEQYYKDKDTQAEAQEVVLESGETLSGIDASLIADPDSSYGAIAGRVTDATTKAGIAGIEVCASYPHSTSDQGGCTKTAAKGEYLLSGVHDGEYEVEFRSPADSSLDYVHTRNGKSFSTLDGSIVPGIDAQLHAGGAIAGVAQIAATGGSPAAGVSVCAYAAGEEPELCAITQADGSYRLAGLGAGSYAVGFETSGGSGSYLPLYYREATLRSAATQVPVETGKTAEPIDAELTTRTGTGEGGLAGVVTDASTHATISGIEVCAYLASGPLGELEEGLFGTCTTTGAGGRYTITGLSPGEYELEFSSPAGGTLSYVAQLYEEGRPVRVSAGHITEGVNAQLVNGGRVSGTISLAAGGHPTSPVFACAFDEAHGYAGCAPSGPGGGYVITGLPAGSYLLAFDGREQGYALQYYEDAALPSDATPVKVTTGGTAPNIDASLQRGATISGEVRNATSGRAIEGALVCALTRSEEALGCAESDPGGRYEVSALPAGTWYVGFDAGRGLGIQYWDGVEEITRATGVVLVPGAAIGGIDAAFSVRGARPTPPPAGHGPSTGTTSTGPPSTGAVLGTTAAKPTLAAGRLALVGRSLAVRLSCRSAPCAGSVTLTERVRLGRARRLRAIVLARGSFTLAAGASRTVHLHLTPAGAKRLAHARRHPVTVLLGAVIGGRTVLTRATRLG